MKCVTCGEDVIYDRVVLRRDTGTAIGGFCSSCEEPRFGRVLDAGDWELSSKCILCDRRGEYALPIHRMDIRQRGGEEVIEEGYTVCAETPFLCSDHLQFIRGDVGRLQTPEPILTDD